jgi:hypothetical protein
MTYLRRAILALVLIAGFSPAFAQAPAPVPALPDVERRTSYSISASQCACAVNFALFGDGTDFANWVEVLLNGVRVNYNDATFGWTITSPSGPLGNIARPITDGVLTFTNVQTGTVQIVGARRPRRVSQFSENRGVAARDINQALTDIVAQNRETWDKTNDVTGRAVLAQPGETLALLPSAASRASQNAIFDSFGNLTAGLPVGGGATVSAAMQPVVSAATIAAAQTLLGINATTNALTTTYSTRAVAISSTIASSVQTVTTTGFAASGDGGGTTYSRGTSLQPCGFQSADGAFWQIAGFTYNWRTCGATGAGLVDDSTAIQASINAAQAIGGVSFGPPGSYKIATGLSITSRVSVWGVGYEASSAHVGASTGYLSTALVCNQTVSCISVSTPSAIAIERLQITYPLTPTAGTAAIILDAPGGGVAGNTDSLIRDVAFSGPDTAIKTVSAYTYIIDHVRVDGAKAQSILAQSVNVPGSGDSQITNSTFSGAPTSAHIKVPSGGGLRINNNKMNGGAVGIQVSPDQVTSQGIAPLFISNNSIEGVTFGILFQRVAGVTEVVGSVVISGNEIVSVSGGILMQASVTNPTVPYIIGAAVNGNFINTGSGGVGLSISGASGTNLVGNQLNGSGSTGISIDGTSTTNIGNTGNNKGPGVL